MAEVLGADSLRYLPVEAISRAIGLRGDQLCQACITGVYPTRCGQELYQVAMQKSGRGDERQRTYEDQDVLRSANV